MENYFQKILRLFTGNEYPESTSREFYRWLTDNEHLSEKDEALQQLWEDALLQKRPRDIHRSFKRFRKKTGIPPVRKEWRIRPIRIWQAAAIVFFILASSSYLFQPGKNRETDLLQQYIPTAEIRTVTLPDGTLVQLNSRSTLLYPKEFTGKERSVYLIGEANFKVKQDKKHPFIVKSTDCQVTAIGTEFNIAAYPEHPEITTTLISGCVLVEYNNLKSKTVLKPNEQLAYHKHTHRHRLHTPDMRDITAWQRGELVFREMSIKEIITILERKYPYTFVYQLQSLKEDRYSFRFKDGATLSEVMEVIVNVVGRMEYKIEGDRCYLLPSSGSEKR